MPRVANCSSMSTRAPGCSLGSSTMTLVLSAPVRSGIASVRDTSTKRVTAEALSPIDDASTARSWWSVMPGGATAASATGCSSRSAVAAATFDDAGMCPCPRRFRSSHRCVCAYATGWAFTVRTSASAVPCRATSTKSTGTRYSPTIRTPGIRARASWVALTPPSTLFSIAMTAPTERPLTTSSSASPTLLTLRHGLPAAASTSLSAASVKVPAGPR